MWRVEYFLRGWVTYHDYDLWADAAEAANFLRRGGNVVRTRTI